MQIECPFCCGFIDIDDTFVIGYVECPCCEECIFIEIMEDMEDED